MAEGKILFVDDDEILANVVVAFLSKNGYEVSTAHDGQEALVAIHQGRPPDLVITDVNMPRLDGLELTRRMRANKRTAGVPIIMLSEHKKTEDILAGYRGGADDYVPKPVELAVLAVKVETLLRRARADRDGEQVALGKVILFLHAKGGAGASTLALNTSVALVQSGMYPVALLDLDLEFGDLPVMVNLVPRCTLADLSGVSIAQLDDTSFSQLVLQHSGTNVWVIAGANKPDRAPLVSATASEQAIEGLRSKADYIVVDTAPTFSEVNLAAIDAAQATCLVATPQLSALRGTIDCLDVLTKLRMPRKQIVVVVNRIAAHGLTDIQVERALGFAPDLTIPHTPGFIESADTGQPLVAAAPRSAAAAKVKELATKLTTAASAYEGEEGSWEG